MASRLLYDAEESVRLEAAPTHHIVTTANRRHACTSVCQTHVFPGAAVSKSALLHNHDQTASEQHPQMAPPACLSPWTNCFWTTTSERSCRVGPVPKSPLRATGVSDELRQPPRGTALHINHVGACPWKQLSIYSYNLLSMYHPSPSDPVVAVKSVQKCSARSVGGQCDPCEVTCVPFHPW
jgi:hypothetical protein